MSFIYRLMTFWCHAIVMNGQGDYLVVSGELGSLVGYRVESRSRALIEIDLTWGYMYPALAKLVVRDMELRGKITA